MLAWLAERVLAYGSVGVLTAVLLLPALEAALPVIGAVLPGQSAVVLGGMLAWHGSITSRPRCSPRPPAPSWATPPGTRSGGAGTGRSWRGYRPGHPGAGTSSTR
ncbi:hypothetical protein SAMN02787118_11534 [Streptomyces mirabilis]|jgi:hypothetical protein|uniref:Uncharacterized protein n=1 Tax=Streptomyces mirabilis TaxID=68239 RepID=A0A1I2NLH2_9ACTN|nr:hypothetical protein SAMN02787118_11534 [Streptomyces mirabilis]